MHRPAEGPAPSWRHGTRSLNTFWKAEIERPSRLLRSAPATRSAENQPTITMDPPGYVVTAFVKFPPIRVFDIHIDPYVKGLIRNYWREVESGRHDRSSMTLLVELCQHIVSLASTIILDAIRPVTSDWHRKAPRIYSHVNPEQCFFGIDESDVLANLKTILPQCFSRAINTSRSIHCESLEEFIRLAAREVTVRVNSRIALIMGSHIVPGMLMTCDCNCISFTTLNTMIGLVTQTVRCIRQVNCQCTSLTEASKADRTNSALNHSQEKEELLRRVIEQGPCDIIYSTLNKKALEILTELTQFARPNTNDNYAGFWCEDSDDWISIVSFDDSDWSTEYNAEVPEEDSVQSSIEWLQGSNNTYTRDRPVDVISKASDKTTDKGPVCSNNAAPQPVSPALPREGQPDVSTAVPAVSSASSESATSSNDDTKPRLVLLLLTALLLHTTKKARTSLLPADFNRVTKNLKDKALGEIVFTDFAISSGRQAVTIYKALFRDLCLHFGSAKVLLQAMVSQDPTVDDLVVQALKTHLTVPAPTPENAVFRFFSSVGKAIMKPCNACLGGSSDS